MFCFYTDVNTSVKVDISQIRTLQIITDLNSVFKSAILIFNGLEIKKVYSLLQIDDIIKKIQENAGDKEKYGKIMFSDPNLKLEFKHIILIVKENTKKPYKKLCPVCGSYGDIKNIKNSGCLVVKPFDGKLTGQKTKCIKLSRQIVELYALNDDTEKFKKLLNLHGKYRKYRKIRTVENIRYNKSLNLIVADFYIAKNLSVLVYVEDVTNLINIKNKRYTWKRVDQHTKANY